MVELEYHFILKYAEKFKNSKVINRMSAHIDVLPTVLELCDLKIPSDRKIDGQSLVLQLILKPLMIDFYFHTGLEDFQKNI